MSRFRYFIRLGGPSLSVRDVGLSCMYWFLIVCFFSLPVGARSTGGGSDMALLKSVLGAGDFVKRWDTGTPGSRSADALPSLTGYAREGGGFAVLLKTDRQSRIVGYSPDAPLPSFSAMPDALKQLLFDAETGGTLSRSAVDVVHDGTSLLLTTPEWGQGAPFNAETPSDGGVQCVTGCTSVALASIMAYHRWPERGRGAVSSYMTLEKGIQVAGRDLDKVYDWSAMAADSSLAAGLLSDIGVALRAEYRADATSSAPQPEVLAEHFRYRPDMRWRYRDDMNADDWHTLLLGELKSGRPVLYTAQRAGGGGHAFVVDGVDSTGFFHVNWGWSGRYNGFWDLNVLTPGTRNYDSEHAVLIGIRPYMTEDSDRLAADVSFEYDESAGLLSFKFPQDAVPEILYKGEKWDSGVYIERGHMTVDTDCMPAGDYLFTWVCREAAYSFTFKFE